MLDSPIREWQHHRRGIGDICIRATGAWAAVVPQGMGIGGSAMFGWLLPDDTHHQVLYEGWDRQQYRPRHGKPPIMVRGAYTAATAMGRARVRYLGAAEEESLAGATAVPHGATGRRPQRAP